MTPEEIQKALEADMRNVRSTPEGRKLYEQAEAKVLAEEKTAAAKAEREYGQTLSRKLGGDFRKEIIEKHGFDPGV